MSLQQNFCSSPWFHMRITNLGNYEYCRWTNQNHSSSVHNINYISPKQYFQEQMQPLRNDLINGKQIDGCNNCMLMEKFNKVSGRQKQLLKVGVRLENFNKTLASSPWLSTFSQEECKQLPQDWQIDLGNFCNSACIFCKPSSSSRLANEYYKLNLIDKLPDGNWTDNDQLVDKFIQTLSISPNIQYLHFIGGETLITPAFKKILKALIDAGLNQSATIGFTTNLTVWDKEVIDLLLKFTGVNLGMSIESFDQINDYVRWPSKMSVVKDILDRWLTLSNNNGWLVQFRPTPTIFTISSLLTVYEFAWSKNIAIESCNFLSRPEFMRPSVLPVIHRKKIISNMKTWLQAHEMQGDSVINTRDPNVAKLQIYQDLESYVNYLEGMPDESFRLPELVAFIKRLESNRSNSVLDYLPDYEELFRSAGY